MKILCNLPLECFAPRETFGDVQLCTYGPADRMWVDGTFYPFDVEFDASRGSVHELLDRLPTGFTPDLLLIWWPDQEPIPSALDDCPIPVVGVLSDYNLTLPHMVGLWSLFDTLLVDRQGVELFRRLSFADTRYFCQYTFKAPNHRIYPDVERDLDVAFAGNLNPVIQRQRSSWIERVRDLNQLGLRAEVRTNIHGADYGRFLNRAWMGFNRSIRREMNLRAFEVPACGALLLMEDCNLEVRDFLEPDHEVVLYNDDNFETVVAELAADRPRCAAIAAAGQRRIQEYSMGRRLEALADLLRTPGPARPPSTALDRHLGRGVALMATWAPGEAAATELVRACDLAPDDPRPRNALALALLQIDQRRFTARIFSLLEQAAAAAPDFVPAAFNLAYLAAFCGHPAARRARDEALRRLADAPGWADLDGPCLPLGFEASAVAHATALGDAVRQLDPTVLVTTLRRSVQAMPISPRETVPTVEILTT